jgi:hypothetical protein
MLNHQQTQHTLNKVIEKAGTALEFLEYTEAILVEEAHDATRR